MRRQQIFECPMRPALRKLPKSFDEYPMPQMLVRTIKRTDSNFAMARLMNIGGVQKKPRVDFARLRQILSGQPDRSVNRDLGEFFNRHGQDADFVQRSDSVCHRRCLLRTCSGIIDASFGFERKTRSSTSLKYRSIASSSALPTGMVSGSSFKTVQNSGSMGRSFDRGHLELMAEPCLAPPRPIGVALRVFRDIRQIQRCGLDALAGQPVRQMVDARGIVESVAIFAGFGTYGGIDGLPRAIKE